jgi:hypothetical protein
MPQRRTRRARVSGSTCTIVRFASFPTAERAHRVRQQTDCGVGFRKRGVSRALARAAVDFARERGARAIEGYPITTKNVILEELHVGTQGVFAAAGFTEVSRPTLRRVVMRVDFVCVLPRAVPPRRLPRRDRGVRRA